VLIEAAIKWAIDLHNEAGGLKIGDDTYMLKLESFDNQYMPSKVAEGAQLFAIDDDIQFVFSWPWEKAAEPIMTQAKKLMIFNSFVNQPNPEWSYCLNQLSRVDDWEGGFIEALPKHHPEIKTLAVVLQRTETAEVTADLVKDVLAPRYGMEVVATEFWEMGTTDLYPVLTKVIAKNPDMMYLSTISPGDAYLLVKQARELGYQGALGGPTSAPGLVEIVGAEYAEGFMAAEPNYDSPYYNEEARALAAEWQRRYPQMGPLTRAPIAFFRGAMCLFQAMEDAGSVEVEDVMKVFDDPDWTFHVLGYDGKLCGLETFGINRTMSIFVEFSEIINGEVVVLERVFACCP